MRQLLETIYEKVRTGHAYQSMEDLYYMSKEAMKTDTARCEVFEAPLC